MPKISCLPVSLFPELVSGKMSIADWTNIAHAAGLDAYDISSMFLREHTTVYIKRIRRELSGSPIPPLMMACYPDFTHPDPDERRRQLAWLVSDMASAQALGFRYLRITAGQNHPGLMFEDALAHVSEYFLGAQEYAKEFGVTLLFENHAKPGAWDLADFSFDPKAFLAIAASIKGSQVGINFDTANAVACGENAAGLYRRVSGQVVTIHLNDTRTVGALTPCALGEGLVDFSGFFAALRETGFDGWLCIEEASGRGTAGIQPAVDFVKSCLREAGMH